MVVEQYENDYDTLLNGAIDSDDTTITVDAAPTTMTGNFRIKIEDELILVGTVNGNDFEDCERGAEGTTAASHGDNTVVTHVLTAESVLNAVPTTKSWVYNEYDSRDYPASPNATYDDEFNDESGMSGTVNGLNARWNWRNQETATATFTKPGWLTINCPSSGSLDWRILEIAAFANGTYEAHLSIEATLTNGWVGGMVIVDGTNGDFYALGRIYETGLGASVTVGVLYYNSVNSHNNTLQFGSALSVGHSWYQRIVKSGTSIELWISEDGVGWIRAYTFTDSASTTRIGVGINESNSTGLTKLHVNYFRKIA